MTGTVTIRVELFGLARRLTGQRAVDVDVPGGGSLRDLTRSLASRYPALVGPVIAESRDRLVEPHIFNVDGLTAPADLQAPVEAGRAVCLLFVVQGG